MTPTQTHAVLLEEAARQNLPECFSADLTQHDLQELTESGTQTFLWVLRTCGTFLVKLDTEARRRDDYQMSVVLKSCECSDARVLWYHFHDGVLTPVSYAQALEAAGLPACYREETR